MQQWLSSENEMLNNARSSKMNYMVETGDSLDSPYCAVYCSSNGIYFPNDSETFERRILKQNKYDWRTNRLSGVKKHIYIRDIQKQWYTEGINCEYDTIPKVAELLQSLVDEGTIFVFLGSSAGGYLAMALAAILGGVVFAGTPQIDVQMFIRDKQSKNNWLIEKYLDIDSYSKWYNLSDKINENAEYYIFYGKKNSSDVNQIALLPEWDNIHLFGFATDVHGVVFASFNVKYFLLRKNKLKRISVGKKSHRGGILDVGFR